MSRLRDDMDCGRMIDPRLRLAALPASETAEDRLCRLCRIWPLYKITKSGERVLVNCEDCGAQQVRISAVAAGPFESNQNLDRNRTAVQLLKESLDFVIGSPVTWIGGFCTCGFLRLDSFKFCPGCGKQFPERKE